MARVFAVLAVLLKVSLATACTVDADCPASAPKCNSGTSLCEATCDTNGGDGFCAGRFGSAPGSERFCDAAGACVPCVGADNAACPLSAPVCSSESCVACTTATALDCADHGALVCSPADAGGSGACVQCLTAADCSGGNICVSNVCTGCTDDASCTGDPAGSFCVGSACVECRNAGDCASGQGCVNNVCTTCTGNASCTGSTIGPFCVTGACVECRDAGDCSAGEGCAANACGSCQSSDANCAGSSVGSKCNVDACVACLANSDCTNAAAPQCTGNACVACSADAGCTGHSQPHCETAATANQGRCVQCRSSNASADCTTNASPQCTANVCGACSGGAGETACVNNHAGRHCEENNTPSALNGQCVICRGERSAAQTDCTSSSPLCNAATDSCGLCDTDGNSECVKFGAAAVCDNPASGGSGACVGCVADADCASAAQPHCVNKQCIGCDPTTVMHGDESCAHIAGAPACQPNDGIASAPGECRQCSFFDRTQCTGVTPACNFVTGGCQLCSVTNGDMGAQASGCATDANGHACEGAGTSVFCGCDSDADCGSSVSGRICDGSTHLCKDGCSRAASRNGCPAGQFCSSNDTTGSMPGVCTTSCQFDADCAAMATMPFCVGVVRVDGGVGTMGHCAACRNDGDCSGGRCGSAGVCVPNPDMAVEIADMSVSMPAEPDLAVPGAAPDMGGLSIGGGGGCGSCSAGGASDPSLAALLLLGLAIHWRRRRRG